MLHHTIIRCWSVLVSSSWLAEPHCASLWKCSQWVLLDGGTWSRHATQCTRIQKKPEGTPTFKTWHVGYLVFLWLWEAKIVINIHPFSILAYPALRFTGGWNLSQLRILGWRWVTFGLFPLHHVERETKNKQAFTPTDDLASPNHPTCACLWTVGGREPTQAQRVHSDRRWTT